MNLQDINNMDTNIIKKNLMIRAYSRFQIIDEQFALIREDLNKIYELNKCEEIDVLAALDKYVHFLANTSLYNEKYGGVLLKVVLDTRIDDHNRVHLPRKIKREALNMIVEQGIAQRIKTTDGKVFKYNKMDLQELVY